MNVTLPLAHEGLAFVSPSPWIWVPKALWLLRTIRYGRSEAVLFLVLP